MSPQRPSGIVTLSGAPSELSLGGYSEQPLSLQRGNSFKHLRCHRYHGTPEVLVIVTVEKVALHSQCLRPGSSSPPVLCDII